MDGRTNRRFVRRQQTLLGKKRAQRNAAETGPGIAVRIVQIDNKNEKSLFEFIDRKFKEQQAKANIVA